MYYLIGIIYFVQLVNADILLGDGYKEGDSCEAEGVQGTCRWKWMCPSYSITKRYHPKGCWPTKCPPLPNITVCSNIFEPDLVCCTDCYINDPSKAMVTLDGVIWKKGVRKSYEKCAEYSANLPYPSKDDKKINFNKVYDTDQKCHHLDVVWKEDKPRVRQDRRQLRKMDFSHIALLGTVPSNDRYDHYMYWDCFGSVISDRFLITSALCTWYNSDNNITLIILGIDEFPDQGETLILSKWQQQNVKRIISHPDYKHPFIYYDLSLIETDNKIQFGKNVLPICLSDLSMIPETVEVDTYRRKRITNNTKVNMWKIDEKECLAKIDAMPLGLKNVYFPRGIDFDVQMCYKAFDEKLECYESSLREGRAIYTGGALEGMKYVVGIQSFSNCQWDFSDQNYKNSFLISIRIDKVLPWIESIAWPELD